jgi:hypothetical protein
MAAQAAPLMTSTKPGSLVSKFTMLCQLSQKLDTWHQVVYNVGI